MAEGQLPRLLDLTRTLRRVDRLSTGIDRVERAYLDRFVADGGLAWGLFRTRFGYLLLDRAGLERLKSRLSGAEKWGASDRLSRLGFRAETALTRAESDLRRWAVARCPPYRLRRTLARYLGAGWDYYNVGHSNLTRRVLGTVRRAGGQIHVMVHDLIPLHFPDLQRPGTVAPFEARMKRVSAEADRIIVPSRATADDVARWMTERGRVPPVTVAPLGVDHIWQTSLAAEDDIAGLMPEGPYFVTVGTIEPRKNHAFLLDLWEAWGPSAPPLLICGARGWNNEEVFARLDALPAHSPVIELPDLKDRDLFALIQRSAGTLFPSLVEGFGLPVVESRALGARLICNDLPVYREFLDETPMFLTVFDQKKWLETLQAWVENPPHAVGQQAFSPPTWSDHFNTVLRLT